MKRIGCRALLVASVAAFVAQACADWNVAEDEFCAKNPALCHADSGTSKADAGTEDDAGTIDDAGMNDDAGVHSDGGQSADAGMPGDGGLQLLTPQIAGGATRMTGGGFTLDAQLGFPVEQKSTTGGGLTLEPAPANKP